MSTNLFDELTRVRREKVRVVLQPGERRVYVNPETGRQHVSEAPRIGSKPIEFEIQTVTSNEAIDADRMITAKAPPIYQEEMSPSRIGMVKVLKGYDFEEPGYVIERQSQVPRREAAICLFGCPALAETTPGNTLEEKIQKILTDLPAALIEWLCREIESIPILSAVGSEDVESFLASGSGVTPSSNDTNKRSLRGGKSNASKDSKAPTSATKSAKRRTTGK